MLELVEKSAERKPMRNLQQLDSILDSVIEFRQSQNGSEAPRIESWNPITRHRQHKELEEWVKARKPSAGITSEQLQKQYPENLKEKQDIKRGAKIGAGIGAGVGAAGAATWGTIASRGLPRKTRIYGGIASAIGGAGIGGLTGMGLGASIGGQKHFEKRMREYERARNKLTKVMTGDKAVPVGRLKTDLPTASTYGEVAGELKKQNVGFIPRHATAILTRPMVWSGENAGFVTRGEKGLIVTSPKVHPAVFRHEAGHGKDYAYYGGEQGFKKAYPKYGLDASLGASREEIISSTMLPEHRAWAYAQPRNKHERDLRDSALSTYKNALGLSALLDNIIEFESITYHETEAERHLRKARVHGDKASQAFTYGSLAATLGSGLNSTRVIKGQAAGGIAKAGRYLSSLKPRTMNLGRAGGLTFRPDKLGGFIQRHPRAIFTAGVYAPTAALGGLYAVHKTRFWKEQGKANAEFQKANEVRKQRNAALAQRNGKTQLSVPIGFDIDIDQVKEKAKHEATKTAVETVYEKLIKGEKPRIRLSSRLDGLIQFQGDTKARNPSTGEYSGQEEGGPDPNAMATVYKMPQAQPQPHPGKTLALAGGAALVGGALGNIGGNIGKTSWEGMGKLVKHLAGRKKSRLVKG